MTPARLNVNLVALAALPHIAVECDPVALYEKFLRTEYPSLPTEHIAEWVTDRLCEVAVGTVPAATSD